MSNLEFVLNRAMFHASNTEHLLCKATKTIATSIRLCTKKQLSENVIFGEQMGMLDIANIMKSMFTLILKTSIKTNFYFLIFTSLK